MSERLNNIEGLKENRKELIFLLNEREDEPDQDEWMEIADLCLELLEDRMYRLMGRDFFTEIGLKPLED